MHQRASKREQTMRHSSNLATPNTLLSLISLGRDLAVLARYVEVFARPPRRTFQLQQLLPRRFYGKKWSPNGLTGNASLHWFVRCQTKIMLSNNTLLSSISLGRVVRCVAVFARPPRRSFQLRQLLPRIFYGKNDIQMNKQRLYVSIDLCDARRKTFNNNTLLESDRTFNMHSHGRDGAAARGRRNGSERTFYNPKVPSSSRRLWDAAISSAGKGNLCTSLWTQPFAWLCRLGA